MLDEKEIALLEKINRLCGEGGFIIAEEGELLSSFPAGQTASREELRRMLARLQERRYIDVKYAEEGEYCLTTLSEGRLYLETAWEKRREDARKRMGTLLFSALGAFLGSLAGTLIFWLVRFAGGS